MNTVEQEINRIKTLINFGDQSKISIEKVEEQLKLFCSGVKIPNLVKPCIIDDGIIRLNEGEFDELLQLHNKAAKSGKLIKFVPASGAASRMFQKLQSVLNRYKDFTLKDLKLQSDTDKESKAVVEFLFNLKKFAFYDELKSALNIDDEKIEKLVNESPKEILNAVLFEPGLNYSSKPKGAIKFHSYKSGNRTAFEEQVYEAINLISDDNKTIKIHFTISEEHQDLFEKIIKQVKSDLGNDYALEITSSFQKKSTDTIAVDEGNKILLDRQGNIIHRPGGHGALIENLIDLDEDIVIIKNIDNLSNEAFSADTILYKKLLIGYLVKIKELIFKYLNCIDKNDFSEISLNEIYDFALKKLFITKPDAFDNWDKETKKQFIFNKLNRPIRVCGMVKNVGEPGGGPFWIMEDDGSLSLQIVEQAQINLNDENQKNIFQKSTHFNPVDLVCGVRDFKNNKFDLNNFVDHQSGIITKKSKDGIELKALELPGLWNGSMADWITLFVEVPISTFNPVKEINDLLRKEHQN